MAEWYHARNGQQKGPVDTATLKKLAAAGELRPTDMIWRDGMKDWVKASSAKGLFNGPVATASRPSTPRPARAATTPPAEPASEWDDIPLAPPQVVQAPTFPVVSVTSPIAAAPMAQAIPRGRPVNYRSRGGNVDYSSDATTAFVLAIVGFFVCGLISIFAFIKASNTLTGIRTNGNDSGYGLALSAKIISGIHLALMVLLIVLGVVAFILGADEGP